MYMCERSLSAVIHFTKFSDRIDRRNVQKVYSVKNHPDAQSRALTIANTYTQTTQIKRTDTTAMVHIGYC